MLTFLTFGGGSKNYHEAVDRLISQVKKLELFDNIIGYTEEILKNDDYFWNKHGNFIENNKRGYGYWLWKSYLILKTIENLKDGDILLYLDCGCEIDVRKKQKLIEYIGYLDEHNILGTNGGSVRQYCKMDLILKLDMMKYINNAELTQACVLLILINDKTRALIKEWYELCCEYSNIDDTPSINKNHESFIEHRHDQSVLGLLLLKYNFVTFKRKFHLHYAIDVNRNKSGFSQIK